MSEPPRHPGSWGLPPRRPPRTRRRRPGLRVPVLILCIAAFLGTGVYFALPALARLHALPGFNAPKPEPAVVKAAEPAPKPDPEAGFPPMALYGGSREVAVLMYHDVTDHTTVSFDTTPRQLRRQFEQLREAGASVVPLADLYEHLNTGRELPPKAVVLTFDDGYLGQYENAYPLLKEFSYPATFFVHTSAVGTKTGKDHMTWNQLKELDQEALVTIESHTVTHPEDLRKLSATDLKRELTYSKQVLEGKLGRKMRFLAYPVGNTDARVAKATRAAGYEMAVTMGPDWAYSPVDAYFVPRFNPSHMGEIVQAIENESEPKLVIRPAIVDLKPMDLEMGELEDGQVRLRWIRGGRLSTVQVLGRLDVPSMVKLGGASAGLNGTFFSDARVNSVGAGIVGPVMARFGPGFAPGLEGDRVRIAGRPFVVISPKRIGFIPFTPQLAMDREGVERVLPGVTDCFLAGAWLIHDGQALTGEEMERFRLSNIFDFRPRAFFGVDNQGRCFLGASSTGNKSDRVAESLLKLGMREVVLLDSGFSTSLTVGKAVLVSGIRRKDMPARPVPHALLLHAVDPATNKELVMAPEPDPNFCGPIQQPSLDLLQARLTARAKAEVSRAEAIREGLGPRRRGRRSRRHR
jgi:biofilm PGA synthesis lipoprotein PgaB